jgi:hypothetical protein
MKRYYTVRAEFVLASDIEAEEPEICKLDFVHADDNIEDENPDTDVAEARDWQDAKQQTIEYITHDRGEVHKWCDLQITELTKDGMYLIGPDGRRRLLGLLPVKPTDEELDKFDDMRERNPEKPVEELLREFDSMIQVRRLEELYGN